MMNTICWESKTATLAAGTTVTFESPVKNKTLCIMEMRLVCWTPDAGFAAGDYLSVPSPWISGIVLYGNEDNQFGAKISTEGVVVMIDDNAKHLTLSHWQCHMMLLYCDEMP
jgi:hypothetical protein